MVIDDPEISVFEKTFSGYLKQVRDLDPLLMEDSLGISLNKDEIVIPLLHEKLFLFGFFLQFENFCLTFLFPLVSCGVD